MTEQVNQLSTAVESVEEALGQEGFASTEEHMQFCATEILPRMTTVREAADTLEGYDADELWPLPKYQEMLFIK